MTDLDEVVRERRSIRMFLGDKPVPRELLDEALELAMRAPSNSNVQPWRLFLASGARRDQLVAALLEVASVELPVTTGLPETFIPLRRQLGALVYGSMGIARDDAGGRRIAQLRNWEFFRAPVGGVVCMHRDLGPVDSSAWACSCRRCCWRWPHAVSAAACRCRSHTIATSCAANWTYQRS